MIVWLCRPHGRAQAFNTVLHDVANVEFDRPLDVLAHGLGSHAPRLSEPTGCTLHPHAELGQSASVVWNLGSAESSWKIQFGDTCGVVDDTDEARARRVDLDIDC